jgi:hypothetical protein
LKASDFRIGLHFTTGSSLWRCTDVGSRTIVGIRLDRLAVTILKDGVRSAAVIDPRDDGSWLAGPPYAAAETVFDEDGLADISIVADDAVAGWEPLLLPEGVADSGNIAALGADAQA